MQNITFKNLHNITPDIIPTLQINHKYLGDLKTSSHIKPHNPHWFVTTLKDTNNQILGYETYSCPESGMATTGAIINVNDNYRKKGYYLGEILRLSSIIMILKNNIKKFVIYSLPSAIYFHTKYKFEPNIKMFKERDSALKDIIHNCENELINFKHQAQDIVNQAMTDKTPEKQRQLCEQTNILLKQYLNEVLDNNIDYNKHSFSRGMDMTLTEEKILNNKEFFNKLYKKHYIDYQI